MFKHFILELQSASPQRKIPTIEKRAILALFGRVNRVRMKNHALMSEYVFQCVTKVNSAYYGAYIFSSGKNMGCFNSIASHETVRVLFAHPNDAYLWTAHGRIPTNTPAGGAARTRKHSGLSNCHTARFQATKANRPLYDSSAINALWQTDRML